ncbi:helix-turn-helix domain-containing protein [Streptomyces sp. NPDC017056]|uniref:helix-turn-helix domain-containing protein n=1 Tax=Streptomyces sp. NPDC017056 TaxID=3364973 RepID=UPI0037A0F200
MARNSGCRDATCRAVLRLVGTARRVNNVDIGQALRELREASGKQAKVVARGAAMSPSKLSKIENGALAPSVIDAERVLAALGVSGEMKARLMRLPGR